MTVPYNKVSRTAARALEDFSDAFKDALTVNEFTPWAAEFGYMHEIPGLRTTWPIPFDAAGYKEFKGDMKYRKLSFRTASMINKKWQDGVEEDIDVVEAPDFGGWVDAPSVMATAWQRHPNVMIADMLALSGFAGPLLDLYKDEDLNVASTKRLFATDHLFNVLKPSVGTFNNTRQVTVAELQSGEAFEGIFNHFSGIKAPDGNNMGLVFEKLLIPNTRHFLFKDLLTQDTLQQVLQNVAGDQNVAATRKQNQWKYLSYTVGTELKSENYFYAFARKPGMYPWVITHNGSPEEILHDKTSAKYMESQKVAIGYIGRANVAAIFPHVVLRVEITA